MEPERVELLAIEEAEAKSQCQQKLALPPKVLQPAARKPRIIIGALFILFGLGLLAAVFSPILVAVNSPISNPCPEITAFSVTIAFGNLNYDTVKIIDAVWNLAVGRGLQAIAAWVCYKIFAMAMLRITQQNQVTLELYSAMSFHPLEIKTIGQLLRVIISNCGWRGRITFIWFVVASTYVFALPTILDLMTGYIAKSTAMVPSSSGDGSLVPLNVTANVYFDSNYYSFNDGWTYGPDAVTCIPLEKYQWGFSITWSMLVVIVTTVWCWGMFGLWFDSQKYGLLWRIGRRSGLYRDILDVSNALQEALGPDTCAYGNSELTKKVAKMSPVGFEAVSEGSTGYIALCHEPVGCAALVKHGVEYGRRMK